MCKFTSAFGPQLTSHNTHRFRERKTKSTDVVGELTLSICIGVKNDTGECIEPVAEWRGGSSSWHEADIRRSSPSGALLSQSGP